MNVIAASSGDSAHVGQSLQIAREIVLEEAKTLFRIANQLDDRFARAVDVITACPGTVFLAGMGKAGLVGQKISATLASTGTRSQFLHPAEALHGDLGRVARGDVALVLSHSGQTEEIVRLVPVLQHLGVTVLAITADLESVLGRQATVAIPLGTIEEAGPLRLAPTTSTTAMMAVGDALALVASHAKGFRSEDFARYHPDGHLGKMLARVEQVMRPLERCRMDREDRTVREILVRVGRPGRRTGAIMLTDNNGVLTGLFTDSDLARLFEDRRDTDIDSPIANLMTRRPTTIHPTAKISAAVHTLARRRISELPVVSDDGRPCGLIDITDVVGLTPPAVADETKRPRDRLPNESLKTIPFPEPVNGNGRR